MENRVHKLMYKKLGETITDKEMCKEIVKALNNCSFGYIGNLSTGDINNWILSIYKRID